jgi:hypothetical protein
VALLRGHGDVVVGPNVQSAVRRAIYTEVNARLQAIAIGIGGPTNYISEEEGAARDKMAGGEAEARAWELWPPLDIMLNEHCDMARSARTSMGLPNWRIPSSQEVAFVSRGEVLGRSLTKDEAREVSGMVRRLAAIILMTDQLDANYASARDDSFAWPHAAKANNTDG